MLKGTRNNKLNATVFNGIDGSRSALSLAPYKFLANVFLSPMPTHAAAVAILAARPLPLVVADTVAAALASTLTTI